MAPFALAVVLVALALWILSTKQNKKSGRLPPGPKPEFLFGNARQVPTSYSWIYYANLAKKFGGRRLPVRLSVSKFVTE